MTEEGEQTVEGADGGPVSTQEERVWAMIAHLSPIVLSFIPPLVIWLVKKDESEFIGDQAKESLNFQINVLAWLLIGSATVCLFIGFLILPVVGIADLILCIVAGIKSYDGVRYRYPFTLRLL